jgi:dipeptidyl aminopeptidase/acylaminoacyl peptidase
MILDRMSGAACCAVLLCLSTLAPAAPPPLSAFAADWDHGRPALSPDGQKVVYLGRNQGKRVVFLLDLAKKQRQMVIEGRFDKFDIRRCDFKNDERLLCRLSGTDFFHGQAYPVTRLISIDLTGQDKPRVLIQKSDYALTQYQDRIIDWRPEHPRSVLILLNNITDGPHPAVFALDVYTGLLSPQPLVRSRAPILNWWTDRHGEVRFGQGFDDREEVYVTRDPGESGWREIAKWKPGESEFNVVGFGPSPKTLLVSAIHNGREAVFEMDLDKGGRQLLFSHPAVDVAEPLEWPSDRRLVGFSFHTDREQRQFFDQEAAEVYATVDASLPDSSNRVIGASKDGKRFLVAAERDIKPEQYYLYDAERKQMQRVASQNPELDAVPLAPMKPVQIKGPDGVMLPGYLTLPVGGEGRNLPTIVYPHGGPHSRDTWGFDPVVQFLASRGYAVVQVNFRGSSGYGQEWYLAGYRKWGTVMVDDINAAARWAMESGIADPKRMCIVGWSYGGYAALMGAIRDTSLYRCVVSIAGVADLASLEREGASFQGGRTRVRVTLGTDDDALKAGSPLRAADRMRAPVLLVHGEDDVVVVQDHSKRMAGLLKVNRRKHELVIIEDGDHSLSRAEWRQVLFTRMEAFLAEYLVDGRVAEAAGERAAHSR